MTYYEVELYNAAGGLTWSGPFSNLQQADEEVKRCCSEAGQSARIFKARRAIRHYRMIKERLECTGY
jgi:hypothetical protein